MSPSPDTIVVTGANGFVGARICEALVAQGAQVRAVVRRAGSAPEHARIDEVPGDFTDPGFAAQVVTGARAVISTVHPMAGDRATQHRIGVQGTTSLARAAASAGVPRLIHISTAAVYDRSPDVADVDESSALVDDDAGDYAVTKRDTDLALGEVAGITTVLLRPPAILGPGPTSTWNTLFPAAIRDEEPARHTVAEKSFAWVHVDDLASLAADLAGGRVPDAAAAASGPVAGACVAVNVAAERATQRDYFQAVTGALGIEPVFEQAPAWTGEIVSERARGWGWRPAVDLPRALAELAAGLGTAD